MSIKIPISAAFDKGSEDAAIRDFTDRFNKLGDAIARANKQQFTPISKATLDDMRRLQAGLDSLRKVSTDLNRRVRATGQERAGFLDLDWSKLYPDQNSRHRQMQKAFDYVTGGSRFSQAPAAAGGGAQPPAPPPPPGPPGSGGGGGRGPGRQIVSAGLNAMGPVGGVANGALSAGLAGGVGAGLAGLAGGLAALAIGKVIGSVREKVGAAQQEFIGYDTLKRTLGDVNVSFNVLRDSLREASRGLDMTFEEGQRLGMQFAKLSGMAGDKTLAEEVGQAGGFSRSFGLDPSQGAAFFAQMRMFRVTTNVEDSRRMGLLIGEAIAKSGAFSKVDEVLEAVAGFTAQQTRMGMNAANVGGYTGMLAGMMGSGIAGMDPASAAALLGRANSTFAAGGGAGEAGQNFIYTALGSRLGLNPVQTAMLREQGLFGTGAGTFGAGSVYSQYAKKFGATVPGGAAGSATTNLEMVMEQLQKVYAGQPDLMADAISRLFGISTSQAAAFATVNPQSLGGLAARLKRNGVNINDVNASGISRIAQIEADGSLSEAEKDKRIKEAATQNQEETEGSRTRATINGVERAIQKAASELVEPLNHIRAGIMYLAGEKGTKSPREILEAVARSESRDREGMINSDFDGRAKKASDAYLEARRRRLEAWESFRRTGSGMSPEEQEAKRAELANLLEAEKKAQERITQLQTERMEKLEEEKRALEQTIQGIRTPASVNPAAMADFNAGGAGAGRGRLNPPAVISNERQAALVDQAQRYFMQAGWSREQAAGIVANLHAESGMRTGIYGDGGRAYGLAQWHPDRQAAFQSKYGKSIQDASFEEQLAFVHHELTAGNERAAGDRLRNARSASSAADVVTRYYERPLDKDGEAYRRGIAAERMAQRQLEQATPMPDGVRPGDDAALARFGRLGPIEFAGNFTLTGPNGQPAAAPVQATGRVPLPRPSGAS